MKIKYCQNAITLYVESRPTAAAETKHLTEGTLSDLGLPDLARISHQNLTTKATAAAAPLKVILAK